MVNKMSTHKGYLMIAILAAASFAGIIPAYAAYLEQACPDCSSQTLNQEETLKKIVPVLIQTDKATYDHQSTIVVTGHVKDPNPEQHLTLKVIDPAGNIVKVDQLEVGSNGDFETKLSTESSLWKKNGIYVIRVQYGTEVKTNQVKVELVGEITGGCSSSQVAVNLGSKSYCIPYTVDGTAMVVSGALDTAAKSLIVDIKAESAGTISLEIPRSILDANTMFSEESFLVLVDGEEVKSREKSTSVSRTVTIPFSAGAEKIEVVGTQIVPEFGAIAALVLAIAIISIIAVSAKTRLRLMPKY